LHAAYIDIVEGEAFGGDMDGPFVSIVIALLVLGGYLLISSGSKK